jgi:hypothetical protein
LLALPAALAVAVALILLLHGGSGALAPVAGSEGAAIPGVPSGADAHPLATYSERTPHVASVLNVYGVQGAVRGAPTTPPDTLPPVSPGAFRAPVVAYLAFSAQRLGLMETDISRLRHALASADRAGAQAAWRAAYAHYLDLGGVYLEGPVAALDQEIDGNPGGLPGGVDSSRFSGLHRIELGLWTGQPLSSLQPWAAKLAIDVAQMRRRMPSIQITPLDYATRAHEILEDAVRDLLSGTDVPWSGEGVLGTSSGLVATREIMRTLSPLLLARENVQGTVATELSSLSSTLASLARAHGGRLPTNGELSQTQSEQLNASIGQALEALAQVPGVLESAAAPTTPPIPHSAFKLDP